MATLTIQNLVTTGSLQPTYAAASGGGDVMPNDGKTVLHVKNGGGGSINVTITAQVATRDAGPGFGPYTRADLVVAVPAAEERIIGPLPRIAFNNASAQAAIAYSGVTSVTVAALRFPPA
jgi:hypothetical protein